MFLSKFGIGFMMENRLYFFFFDVYDLQVFSHVNSCISHRVFLFLPGRKRRLSSTSPSSGGKTCEKFGKYFFYFVGEAEQLIIEGVEACNCTT